MFSFLGDNTINEFFQVQSVLILIGADDVVEAALDEFGVNVDSLEVKHVFLVEVLPRLGL